MAWGAYAVPKVTFTTCACEPPRGPAANVERDVLTVGSSVVSAGHGVRNVGHDVTDGRHGAVDGEHDAVAGDTTVALSVNLTPLPRWHQVP